MRNAARASLLRCRSRNWAWDRSRRRRGRRGSAWLYRGLDVGAIRRAARCRWRCARWARLAIRARDRWLYLRSVRGATRGEHRPRRLLWWCPACALGRSGCRWLRSWLGGWLRGWLRSGRLCCWLRCTLRLRRWLLCRLGATTDQSGEQPLLLRHASPRNARGRQHGSCSPTRCRTR